MAVDFSIIQELSLKKAFNEEEKIRIIDSDEDYLNELFEHSQKSQLFIYDDEDAGYSRFVSDTNGLGRDKTISIDNSNHRDVFLMRIDGMLFSGMSKCDCALLSEKEMFFIELKTNAANKTDISREDRYEKCISQLKQTIKKFDDHYRAINEDFRKKKKRFVALAVFNPTVPRNNASEKALCASFLKEIKMRLCFTNLCKVL